MKNILIIDDTKSNIDLLIEYLDEYNIFVATNPFTGLEILEENKIDLVLLDIMMPEMDGYEVCKIIRENPKLNNLPIIFLTAKSQEEDIEKAYEIGGNDYITKPFKQKELLARIHTQLKISYHNQMLENLLIQQSKLASMGEMIDSIAHQWKQPLNIISMSTQLLEIDFEEGNVDNNYIYKYNNKILAQIEHLVETLDEFRTFFRPNHHSKQFDVKTIIDKSLVLLQDEIQKHNLNVEVNEISPYQLYGNENEFKHIIINLINNSKDAFLENKIRNKHFKINIDGKKKIIEFIDNAGGIPQHIIDEIFNINFTTKSTGTGMGLYMSNQIAKKLKARLKAINTLNGVKFIFESL